MAKKTAAQQKYLASLPRLPDTEPPERRKKMESVKDRVLAEENHKPSAPALVHRLRILRDLKEEAEASVKSINVEVDAVTELLVTQFEAEGVESVRTTNTLVSVWVEPYTSVVDHDELREWCVKNGLGRSLQLPWQTVNSVTKQYLEAGQPAPKGVSVFLKSKIRMDRS